MELTALLLCLLMLLVSLIVYKLHAHLNYFKNRGIAYEPPHLLTGNMQGLRKTRSFSEIWRDFYVKFKGSGPFAGFFLFQAHAAFILDIELVKNILIKDFSKFTDRGLYCNEKDDPLSGQLFKLDGQKWRSMRHKLSPTFTSGKMKYMFPTIVKVGERLAQVFDELVQQNAVIEVKEMMARFTTDVIGSCAFGIDCRSLQDPQAEFRVMVSKALTDTRHNNFIMSFMFMFPRLAKKLHMKETPDYIEKFFLRIVRETVEHREKNNIRRNDFMDLLIDLKNNKLLKAEDGEELSNLTLEEVAAQAFLFFAAGLETSSTAMSFALYELARNPYVQQRAREEVREVLTRHQNEFTYECMKELQYLERVIDETLRLYTILPVLNRKALVDYPVPGNPGYVIAKGMSVIIPIEGIHLDPEYYPEPHVFDPERFAPDAVKARDPLLWMPFGDGPRNCIGLRFAKMQTRIGLALLLTNFTFSTCEQTHTPFRDNVWSFAKNARDGIHLKVEAV